MGAKVLDSRLVGGGGVDDVHVFAHCAAGTQNGSVALAFINISPTKSYEITAALANDAGLAAQPLLPSLRYHFAPAGGNMLSTELALNGEVLRVDPRTATFPPLRPVHSDAPSVHLSPNSFAFAEVPAARAGACAR